jgi:prefoldin subunit 2
VKSKSSGTGAKGKVPTKEQIFAKFQEMRNQQRATASKMSEIEMDRKEHELVIEALKEVDGDRKCFRMVGGVLVERTVKEVLPVMTNNYEQLGKVLETLQQQLEAKGRELQEYREKHNIQLRGDEEARNAAAGHDVAGAAKTSGVLVASGAS